MMATSVTVKKWNLVGRSGNNLERTTSFFLMATSFHGWKIKSALWMLFLQRALNTHASGYSFQRHVCYKLLGAVPTGIEPAVRNFLAN
jgi:hypothetical protein